MNVREFLQTKLENFKTNLQGNQVDFNAIETLLLNPEARAILEKESNLQKKFQQLRSKAIEMVANELYEISRYRFVAIPPAELLSTKLTIEKTPNYLLYIKNCQSITYSVIYEVISKENYVEALMVCDRWIQIMMQMITKNDYATALAIFVAFESNLSKYKNNLCSTNASFLNYVAILFDSGASKSQSLRDMAFGRAIPQLTTYSSFISAKAESMEDKSELEETNTSERVIKTVFAMQKSHAALLNLPYKKEANKRIPFSDDTIFTNYPLLVIKYLELAKTHIRLLNIEGELKDTDTPEERRTKELRAIFLKHAAFITTDELNILAHEIILLRSIQSKSQVESQNDLTDLNAFLEILHKNSPIKLSRAQAIYQKCLTELRAYAASGAIDDAGKKRRRTMTTLLNELSWNSKCTKKIELLDQAIRINDEIKAVADAPVLYNEHVVAILKRLKEALTKKNDEDLKTLIHYHARKYLKQNGKLGDEEKDPLRYSSAGGFILDIPRLNFCSSKNVHYSPVNSNPIPEEKVRSHSNPPFCRVNSPSLITWEELIRQGTNKDLSFASDSEGHSSQDDGKSHDGFASTPSSPTESGNTSPIQTLSSRSSSPVTKIFNTLRTSTLSLSSRQTSALSLMPPSPETSPKSQESSPKGKTNLSVSARLYKKNSSTKFPSTHMTILKQAGTRERANSESSQNLIKLDRILVDEKEKLESKKSRSALEHSKQNLSDLKVHLEQGCARRHSSAESEEFLTVLIPPQNILYKEANSPHESYSSSLTLTQMDRSESNSPCFSPISAKATPQKGLEPEFKRKSLRMSGGFLFSNPDDMINQEVVRKIATETVESTLTKNEEAPTREIMDVDAKKKQELIERITKRTRDFKTSESKITFVGYKTEVKKAEGKSTKSRSTDSAPTEKILRRIT